MNHQNLTYIHGTCPRIAPHEWNESQEWLNELKRRASSPGPATDADVVMARLRDRDVKTSSGEATQSEGESNKLL